MVNNIETQVNEWLGRIFGDNYKYYVSDGDLGEWMKFMFDSSLYPDRDAPKAKFLHIEIAKLGDPTQIKLIRVIVTMANPYLKEFLEKCDCSIDALFAELNEYMDDVDQEGNVQWNLVSQGLLEQVNSGKIDVYEHGFLQDCEVYIDISGESDYLTEDSDCPIPTLDEINKVVSGMEKIFDSHVKE